MMNRNISIGQLWRRRDPSGTCQEFRITGFQPSPFNPADTALRGRTASGKRIIVARRLVEMDVERFELNAEAT